jgi:hypothetical protein
MNARLPLILLLTLACGLSLSACSKENAVSAPDTVATLAAGPVSDPCAMFTQSEVSESFAGAKAGTRNRGTDQYGVATCTWDTPTNTFVLQLFSAKGSVEDELRARASGAVDPVKPGAGKNIRYEKFPGGGDDAMQVVEKGNADEGLFNDIVVLVMRKGDRMAVLFAHSLVDDDRTMTLASMAALGRSAGQRL